MTVGVEIESAPMPSPWHASPGVSLELSGVGDPELVESLRHCRRVTRRAARNFYYGLCVTPEPRRSALFAIYAWMRRADDEADANTIVESRRVSMARLREQTERALAGDPPRHADPMWLGFSAAVRSYAVDPAWMLAMLDGLEGDLDKVESKDEADLERYCYRVASTVGMTCVAIWGLRPGVDAAEAMALARLRGVGFQLTNILRDFTEDFDHHPRRVYLPKDSLSAHGISAASLRAWSQPDACRAFVMHWVERARRCYIESAALDRMIDRPCTPVLGAMTRIYRGLLEVIAADPDRGVRGKRVRLRKAQKAQIALGAMLQRRTGIGV